MTLKFIPLNSPPMWLCVWIIGGVFFGLLSGVPLLVMEVLE